MRLTALPFIVLLVLVGGCEVPGDEAPVPPPVIEAGRGDGDSGPAQHAKEEAERRAKEEADRRAKEEDDRRVKEEAAQREAANKERERQSALRSIDGRRSPTLRAKAAAPMVASAAEYRDGGPPTPFAPPDATMTVARRAELLAEPAASKEKRDAVVVVAEDRDSRWEAALLRQGAIVLDRSMLPYLERELYLQEASIADQDAVRLSRNEPLLLPMLPVTGREPYELLEATFWIRAGVEDFRPVLSGRSVPQAARLPIGVAESATAVLRLEEARWRDGVVTVSVAKPAAKAIVYLRKNGEEASMVVDDAEWQTDKTDPWLRRCKGGIVYYDPAAKALWRLDRAWLGGPVTRDAYIKARTRDETPLCAACRRPIPGKAKVVRPDDKATPQVWWCPDCEQTQAVAYFDGYAVPGGAHHHDHAVVEWQWVKPAPGLYPVLAPPASRGDGHAFEIGGESGWTHASLSESLRPATLLKDAPGIVCWVRGDGSSILFAADVLEGFERQVVDGAPRIRMPACDASGAQQYALEREPFERATVSIPVVGVELDVRMAMSASTRLVLAGNFALDYRNLLAGDVAISVGVDGPDLANWPTADEQREALLARLRVLVAEAVVK